MVWLYYLLLLIADICGLALTAVMMPGLWIMVAAAAGYGYLTHGHHLGWKTMIALFLLALGAEFAEIFIGGAGAKKAGASKWGILGGLIGAIVGAIIWGILLPAVGAIIGICLGSFVGAFGLEMLMGKPAQQSAQIGLGAAHGRFLGILTKLGIGIVMLFLSMIVGLPIR